MGIISVNTFWTIFLIIHGLLAVALLGALTHQAVAVVLPVRQLSGAPGFVTRFRAVTGPAYATAVCVLWIFTFIIGAWIYVKYRIYIRMPIEQAGYWKTQGFFDMKEHVVSFGLGLLPAYWYLWKEAKNSEYDRIRKLGYSVARWRLLVWLYRGPEQRQRVWDMTVSTGTNATPAATTTGIASKVRTFSFVFSLAFPVIYVFCELFGAPLFTYHPATNRFDLGWSPGRSGEGPAMHWYGWVMSSVVGAFALGLIGTWVPERAVKKIPLALLVILPTLALIPLAYSLMPYWTRG